jgi:hypothetical protein
MRFLNRRRNDWAAWIASCLCTILPLLLLHLFSENAKGESYIWPLKDNFGVSATFGESRDDHFHAGIDLSTNGETGLPVLAIADGEIYRLKVQKRGYGKALYIKHSNGMISVYAHLEGYSRELGLQQEYESKIAKSGTRYVGDIFLEPPIRVKQGTVIAFSGESGAGLPHLHLELRRTENTPVNPFLYGFQDTQDPVAPTFQACYFYPEDAESAVDGMLDTQEIRFQRKDVQFQTDHSPVVRGDFYVSVSAYDSGLRPYHRAPHKILYSIDNRVLYTVEFNEFSYDEQQDFGLIYDLGKPGPSYYEYPMVMNKPESVKVPFVASSIPFSTKVLVAGQHRLQIEAVDSNNNSSIAAVDFIVNHPPRIQIDQISRGDTDLVIGGNLSDPDWRSQPPSGLAGELEYSLDEGKTFYSFPMTTLDVQSSHETSRLVWRAPLALFNQNQVLIRARGFDGIEYSPYSIFLVNTGPSSGVQLASRSSSSPKLSFQNYRNAIQVTVDSREVLAGPLKIEAGSAGKYWLTPVNLNSYQANIPVPRLQGPFVISFDDQELSIPVHYTLKNEAGVLSGENYALKFEPDSLFQDGLLWAKSMPPYQARYLSFVGSLIQFGPRGLPLKRKGSLVFNYPQTVDHPERLSIYTWNRSKQTWQSLPSTVNRGAHTVETQIVYLDLYALIYDNVPPKMRYVFPARNSKTRNETPKLAVEIHDAGMDVDDEKVTFYLDGAAKSAEYDPDRNLATYKVEKPLRKGLHSFYAVAYDWAGNKSVSNRVLFRIR